jgi:hypothetical protein
VYEDIPIELWITLREFRQLFLDLAHPLQQLTPALFTNFIEEMRRCEIVLAGHKCQKYPSSHAEFVENNEQIQQEARAARQSYDFIDAFKSKEELYHRRGELTFQKSLD